MCEAFATAHRVISQWLNEHPSSFPPVVIHITDGESTDGDPSGPMKRLTSQASSDGNALLMNVHISTSPSAQPIEFPDSPQPLPDEYARTLFEGASELTPSMRSMAQQQGLRVSDGARGFVLNADMVLVIKALDIGTKAANVER